MAISCMHDNAMKKIIAVALPLLVLSLIAIQANAVVTPVEVERIKGTCFIRMRGDHHTQSFVFHYVNLSPDDQAVSYSIEIWDADGNLVACMHGWTRQ